MIWKQYFKFVIWKQYFKFVIRKQKNGMTQIYGNETKLGNLNSVNSFAVRKCKMTRLLFRK